MPFQAQLEECHVLNPYPELNSRDTFRATTQGTLASRPLRYPRSLVDHTHHNKHSHNLLSQNRLVLLTRCHALFASRPPGRGHVPPGANAPLMPMPAVIAWQNNPHRQASHVPVATSFETTA
ncbi:hypothetical protein DEO72_LG2g3732 [Vigna unguiculata]|uniref:Uncharacterized protein n=1 Tax=Vigna unguiculata TaxID=3917 RepID=A0A4D6L4I1_VIGUN|nr:hypothetical protein DEO72_LG2g3732 [Vigna unguiculata]